ncbi:G-protein coupled receptors family 1 profile domain-containing protein [Caenorhabditis elegans]|uniref:G-protein coupled receptors family 1 profile domain-containing protein n=1 Tax=Caenorhabditis elegans TaxID=6239 RepID=P91379_CAEEL|nr:G-protein coupled receptors family 1 profile domain-containing protein [Caenorhabditis elegans]CCD67258.1 G-protein coupled receptors family 1 profile domain-containing protein [Caenorhabditis elegans]|eukprot:NP_503815.2 Serpentine Receptor, class W [Caenorhabditis elegans]
MYLSDCKLLSLYYAGFEKSTAKSLCEFEKKFIPFSSNVLSYLPDVSIASILINLIHFFILTRKPMRTSSINILMAAIALFDILASLQQIELLLDRYSYIFFDCYPTYTYGLELTKVLLDVVRDYSRRCSTWLIVFIAFIRTLIVRNPMSTKFEALCQPKASAIIIAGICATSFPVSVLKFLEYQFIEIEGLESCAKGPHHIFAVSDLFTANDGFLAKYFYLFNSFVSDIVPCILLPIVTLLLVMDLWRAAKKRTNLISVSKNHNSRTGLVFCVTIMFFIVEFPYGLSMGFVWMYNDVLGLQHMMSRFAFMFAMLITLNTCTHLFVCLIISSHYRSTAIYVFSCGYINSKNTIASRTQVTSSSQSKTL